MEEDKRIIIYQDDPGEPIKIEILGSWKAKEIASIERQLVIAYRRRNSQIRKQGIKEEEEKCQKAKKTK